MKLYIQDLRISNGIHKNRVQHISIKATEVDHDLESQGVVHIQTHDIIHEIQNSYTPITGSGAHSIYVITLLY